MSTPFDPESARFLKRLGVRRIKISSGDVTNLPMLEVVGALGLPVILSTGMADLAEVGAAVATLRARPGPPTWPCSSASATTRPIPRSPICG